MLKEPEGDRAPHTYVYMTSLPYCDFCKGRGVSRRARFDGKTTLGGWAWMCRLDFATYGIGLGTGLGQELLLEGATIAEILQKGNGNERQVIQSQDEEENETRNG